DREEFIAGLVAVAVPVRDREGEVRAAIAVHAPTARMSLEAMMAELPALRDAAARMSDLL
ncbi:MAG: transcriptional regulator, IclR family, partial [Rhizobacter sp.]|nr:transcriptional regulator, IclR family [Rhizobacter sp.]